MSKTRPAPQAPPQQPPEPTPEERRRAEWDFVTRRIDPATYGLPGELVTDVAVARLALVRAVDAGLNVLAPEVRIEHIPRHYGISFRLVAFDARFSKDQQDAKSNGLWYIDSGKLAMHWSAINLLAQVTGIEWLESTRVDQGETKLVWRYRAAASIRYFNGQRRTERANKELDLRDGSAASNGMASPAQLAKARMAGAELCESRAKARVVRALLGLQAAYHRDQAGEPFVWPALVFCPPPDPRIDLLLAMEELGISARLFGPGGPVLADPGALAALPGPAAQQPAEAPPTAPAAPQAPPQQQPEPEQVIEEEPMPEAGCSEPGCGEVVSDDLAAWCRRNLGVELCRRHAKAEQERRRAAAGARR